MNILALLSQVPLFADLKADELELLCSASSVIFAKKDELVFRAGHQADTLYIVATGQVKMYQSRKGSHKEEIVCIVNSKQYFCLAPVLSREIMHINAKALEETKLIAIPKTIIDELIQKSHPFSKRVIQHLAIKECGLCEQVCDLSLNSPKERLAKYLIEQFQQAENKTIQLTLKRTELASHLGTVRESLSRHLTDFKKAGIISLQGKKIQLHSLSALEDIAFPCSSRGLQVIDDLP